MNQSANLIKQIDQIETKLRSLKLNLQEQQEKEQRAEKKDRLEIGDRVVIKTKRRLQGEEAVVTKINPVTQTASLKSKTKGPDTWRKIKNLQKVDQTNVSKKK